MTINLLENSLLWKIRQEKNGHGQPQWPSGLMPPSAQGVILETRDQVPCWAPCMVPASPSACVSASLSSCVSMNK